MNREEMGRVSDSGPGRGGVGLAVLVLASPAAIRTPLFYPLACCRRSAEKKHPHSDKERGSVEFLWKNEAWSQKTQIPVFTENRKCHLNGTGRFLRPAGGAPENHRFG